jgi:hypothetical protein
LYSFCPLQFKLAVFLRKYLSQILCGSPVNSPLHKSQVHSSFWDKPSSTWILAEMSNSMNSPKALLLEKFYEVHPSSLERALCVWILCWSLGLPDVIMKAEWSLFGFFLASTPFYATAQV